MSLPATIQGPFARIEPSSSDIPGFDADKHVLVRAYWEGDIDRTDGHGWIVLKRHAPRLVAAIEAGVVFTDITVETDVNGNTYVSANSTVLGRYMNADLKRLGF